MPTIAQLYTIKNNSKCHSVTSRRINTLTHTNNGSLSYRTIAATNLDARYSNIVLCDDTVAGTTPTDSHEPRVIHHLIKFLLINGLAGAIEVNLFLYAKSLRLS